MSTHIDLAPIGPERVFDGEKINLLFSKSRATNQSAVRIAVANDRWPAQLNLLGSLIFHWHLDYTNV
jgi:hypothetical protein